MTEPHSISTIVTRLQESAFAYSSYCGRLSPAAFFRQTGDKWSPAQQTRHLVTSTNSARLAYTLPAFLVRWIGGKPNRASRSFDELVTRYHQKLEQGGKASGKYIPKNIPPSYGQERLLKEFNTAMQQFSNAIEKKFNEARLDQYLAPHPLLGRITLRELAYFTIHHCDHHLEAIRNLPD